MLENWLLLVVVELLELLDDLREVIWNRYQLQLHEQLRSQRYTSTTPSSHSIDETDPSF